MSNVEIKATRDPYLIKQIAAVGLRNRIFHSDGCMKEWYKNSETDIHAIAIAYIGNTPVGIAMITNTKHFYTLMMTFSNGVDKNILGVYVKTLYRKKGIGTKLVEELKKVTKVPMVAMASHKQGILFYKKTKVKNVA